MEGDSLIEAINLKALEVFHKLQAFVRSERGQTTAEYVAITAVGVALAIGVVFGLLDTALDSAVTGIGDGVGGFVTDNITNAGN